MIPHGMTETHCPSHVVRPHISCWTCAQQVLGERSTADVRLTNLNSWETQPYSSDFFYSYFQRLPFVLSCASIGSFIANKAFINTHARVLYIQHTTEKQTLHTIHSSIPYHTFGMSFTPIVVVFLHPMWYCPLGEITVPLPPENNNKKKT